MALNEVYKDAQSISYVVNQSVESGDFVWLTAGIRGVAETDAELGADGSYYATIRHSGVFTGTTADAVTVGAAIYLASAATFGTALTTTAGSNKLVGYAIKAKSGVAGDVFVRINN
jgi:predicted RecA/RadA family phage recombinase